MKAAFLTTVFVAFILTTSVNAKNVKTYSNVENNESGTKKEYTTVDDKTLRPITKEVYIYDQNGKILEKEVCNWGDNTTGWISCKKYEYSYTVSGKIAGITYKEWDNKINNWAHSFDFLDHIYDENDELLLINQMNINDLDKFITHK